MLPSTATFLLSLAGLAAALPNPGAVSVSKLGAPFSADDAVSPAPHMLEKRQACASTRSCPRMANARGSCQQGQCAYWCNDGYVVNPYTKLCVPSRTGRSRTVAGATTSAQPTSAAAAPTTAPVTAVPIPTTTPTTAAPPASTSAAAPALSAVDQLALDEHNSFRALHGAKTLVWDTTLAAYALSWANRCVFEHSQGPYGENLAATAGGTPSVASAIQMWEAEAKDYNPAAPNFSHFTAMVWKSTSKLGCAWVTCPPGSIFDAKYPNTKFTVCSYSSQVPNSGGPDNYRLNVQP